MKNEEEDKKWIEEYPTLKQVNPVNAFVVPQNYFAEMEEQVMAAIRLQGLKLPTASDGFSVPANYFDDLTQNINSRVAIEQALTGDNAFTVPENYFEDLTQNIQSRIAVSEALSIENTFKVPDNYFEELSGNIQSRIAIEEALNTGNAFAVPEGYFADLESRILAQTTVAPAKQLVKQQRQGVIVKLLVSKSFKYASAACFALVVGSALYTSEFNNPVATHNRSSVHKAVAKMTTDELEIYLQLNSDNAAILSNVDPESFDTQAAETNTQLKNN
jgi:ABC-type dipeptide/oligopeptide/nickel transport system ATPase subunit